MLPLAILLLNIRAMTHADTITFCGFGHTWKCARLRPASDMFRETLPCRVRGSRGDPQSRLFSSHHLLLLPFGGRETNARSRRGRPTSYGSRNLFLFCYQLPPAPVLRSDLINIGASLFPEWRNPNTVWGGGGSFRRSAPSRGVHK